MNTIRVLHTGNFDEKAGGPAMSTYYTLKGLISHGIQAELLMYEIKRGGKLIGKDVPIHYVKRPIVGEKLSYSSLFKKAIRLCGNYDIYHAQGIWQYPTYAIVDVARERERPYIITPRGMLYPQDIAKSNKLLKELSLKYRLLRDLNGAACIQVTCKAEMMHCRSIGVTSPIAVIPNSIGIKSYCYKKKDNIFRVGYLGRLSPRKNVQALLYSWSALGTRVENAELIIMGSGNRKYEHFLHKEVERLNLKNVIFTGFLADEEKDNMLASISVLALPSEFENFGNVILEALVRGIPCIATKGAPWNEIENCHCGWWIDFSQGAITSAINEAMNTPVDQLKKMGNNGIQLVKEKYTYELVGNKMEQLYKWVLGYTSKPDFVYLYGDSSHSMKIVHYIPSIDRSKGGTSIYMQLLGNELGKLVDLHIVTHRSDHPVQIDNCMIHYIPQIWQFFEMKKRWNNLLHEISPALVHINCCWMPSCAFTQKWAQKRGYKIVLTPHGMLEPWILKRHYLTRKIPAMFLYQKNAIKQVDCIHSTSYTEGKNLKELGYNPNVKVIPTGIEVDKIQLKTNWQKKKNLLYLSRIHYQKGIEYFIEAIYQLKNEMHEYKVTIAGEGEQSYIQSLENKVAKYGLSDIIEFVGGKYGDEKWILFRNSDFFVLPTFSENFGIVVAESLASGTPVITTKGAPWMDLETYNCGKWIEIGMEPLKEALEQSIALTDEDLKQMGLNGRKLVEERYSSRMLSEKMVNLYNQLL